MPRRRPKRVALASSGDQPTRWFLVAHNDDPQTPVILRVRRPAGGGLKGTQVAELTIEPGTRAQLAPLDGGYFEVPPYRRLYVTVYPPLSGAGARIEQVS